MNKNISALLAFLTGALAVAIVAYFVIAPAQRAEEIVVEEDGQEEPVAEVDEEPVDTSEDAQSCAPVSHDVAIETDETSTTHSVHLGGELVETITVEFPESEARIYRQTSCYAYVAISATGRGGYILYGGPDLLYRLDLTTKALEPIAFQGFLSDVSADETLLVSISSVSGENVTPALYVVDIETGSAHGYSFQQPPYQFVGDAKFSPNGKKIAFSAAVGNPEMEESALFILDLETGEFSAIGKLGEPTTDIYHVSGWADNDTPLYY